MANVISQTLVKDSQTLAEELVTLYRAGKEEEAKALAERKIEKLLEDYSVNYVLKSCTKGYREAIYQAYYGTPFPGKKATEEERAKYFAKPVSLFTPPDWMKEQSKNQTEKTLKQKRSLQIQFPDSLVDKLLIKALELLRSEGTRAKDYYAKGVALELLTGRRQYSEICFSASFEPLTSHTIYVSGLAKTTLEGTEIPVLGTDSLEISQALEELREYIQSRTWFTEETTSRDIKGKIDKITREVISSEFQPIINDYYSDLKERYGKTWVAQFPSFSTHDFRALWAVICHKRINREATDLGLYASEIIGHTSERNTRHYQLFKVVADSDFQYWKENIVPSQLS